MDNVSENILKGALEILWSQWSTLGAYLTAEKTTAVVVDPEAALVGTCSIGRADPRLFDEVLDWLIVNYGLIKAARVTRFAEEGTHETARAVAAIADYTSLVVGQEILQKFILQERNKTAHGYTGEARSFFIGSVFKSRPEETRRELDSKFLEWGFRRSEVETRGHSGKPDMNNPANVMLLMRAHYGKSARADVLTYLLTGRPESTYQIARMTGYNQSTVYRELQAMSEGGPVMKEGRGKSSRFLVDKEKLAQSLWGVPTSIPVYFKWADIFKAFDDSISTINDIGAKGLGGVLKVEAFICLSERITPLIRGAGEPLKKVPAPDPLKLKRPDGEEEIFDFIEKAMNVIREALQGG